MTTIRLILVPYDSGNYALRHGLGPQAFLDQNLVKELEDQGHQVDMTELTDTSPLQSEISTSFKLMSMISEATNQAENEGAIPVVIAGNCNSSVGAISGLTKDDLHVFWFDGNADFNTPETTESGFLDGMGLAMLAGKCWSRMLAQVPGYQSMAEDRLTLMGARDFDPEERIALEQSNVSVVSDFSAVIQGQSPNTPTPINSNSRLFIHLDVDVYNPDDAPANSYQPAGGPSVRDVQSAITNLIEHGRFSGLTISSYDPSVDPERQTVRAIIELLCSVFKRV